MLRRLIFATALVAPIIALAACGGGGKSNTKTPSATKTVAKTASAGTATVTGTGTPDTATPATPAATTPPAGGPTATRPASQPPPPTSTRPPTASGQEISVGLREFSLTLSAGSAHPGALTFNISNEGTVLHDFLVIKSDAAVDALPMNQATYTVDETQVNVVAKQPPLATEDSAQLFVNLSAGRYLLICNVATHYQAGMRIVFTVQ